MWRCNVLGLFYYHYDYHEWEDLVCVSTDKAKLAKEVENDNRSDTNTLVLTETEHKTMAKIEQEHYFIRKVEVL